MKTKNLIERLSLFLLALVLTMPTWAQGNNGMEVVSISSAADWKTFCQRVNDNGEPFLNAKLTQDVDLGGEIVMLGSVSYPYSGTFDGQGHTLSFNWNAGEDNQIAPFYYVENATIKNLRTQGKITSKGYSLSGMVYAAFGTTTLTGCISDVDITGGGGGWNDSKAAGMVQAVADGASVTITDCLVKGSITDNADEDYRAMAGFVFSNSGTYTLTRCLYVGKNNATNNGYSKTFGKDGYGATFTDCYYLNTCGKVQGEQVTAERLKSGEMAKLLQGDRTDNVWGQTLGTDLEPLPTTDATKRVYEVKFTYNGEVKATRYANSGKTVELPTAEELLGTGYNPKMTYTLNFGNFTATTPVTEDKSVDVTVTGTFDIATAADWKEFCALVNGGQTTLNAKMTADVDLGTDIAKVGTANKPYAGTFDGQNHVLTVNWDAGSVNNIAPFGRVNGATIKNLRTEGSIRSDGYYLSGLIDEAYGGSNTVANCVSAVNITSSYTSDRCGAGGLISYIFPSARVTINDCLVKGSIDATTEKGQKGMGGFVYSQNGTCTLTRCLYAGTNNADNSNNNCYTFAPTNTSGATTTLNNCYYLNTCGKVQGEPVTKEQLKNGYVAHKLQGTREETVWGQKLGTDNEPQLTAEAAKRVYEVKFTYNGKEVASRYANRGGNVGTLPTPQEILGVAYNTANTYKLVFADGFYAEYPIYADRTVAVDVIVNNMCEIATKEDWKKFGDLVRSGERNLNAKLTADLNLGTDILKIGSESTSYSGTFDGQGHTITIDWNGYGGGYFALFPFVTDATIKNLRVTGQMTTDAPMGVFALNADGNTTFSGCVSDVKITNGNTNSSYCAAGMVLSAYSKGKITFKDCIVSGDLNGTTDNSKQNMGGFVCSQADDATCTFDNCLYTGTNNSKGGYAFAPNPTLNNCYYLNPCGKAQGERIVEKQLASGEVAYKLQGDRTDSCHWAQVLGEWPGLYRETDKAKPNYVYYNKENNGWTCDDFRLTDGQSLPIGLDFTATKATYDRTLAAGKATLCLPYELPVQGFKAYTLADRQESRTAVHFKEVNGTLGAYRPYLLVADGTPQLGGENLQVKADRSSIVLSAGNYYFKGAVHDVVNWWLTSDHAYILQADGLFHKVTSNNPSVTVPAYRAYISYNSHEGAKRLSIVFDGETTGIYGTTDGTTDGATDGAADGAVYNLQGQRVADRLDDSVRRQIPTGVYIVNGRKVVVK
ncbi:hypothetical protein [Segatella buccae]|uniref:GLUG domain-containing protein n=1 Tax=Segatella buccae ATCC 33574 TaxID=873513 RepID=E6K9F6_9BACT|nr:hypothetical protein [Segatella buccae]EFU29832.1 hypothetical protein HMPREF6485_2242 [Segatella buccae ATCC 33574]